MEELQLLIEKKLFEIPMDKLVCVANYLKITVDEDKSMIYIIRKVRECIEKALKALQEAEAPDEKLGEYLKDILAVMSKDPPPLEGEESTDDDETESEVAQAKQDLEILEGEFALLLAKHEKKVAEAKERLGLLGSSKRRSSTQNFAPSPRPGDDVKFDPFHGNLSMKNVVRIKEFKITGVISNEKNRLSYNSLNKQIESAIERGYPEREIIDGIINAVSPSLHLKSYLESIKSLRLAQLRQILLSHYCEKSASEVYHELTNIVQEANESPLTFLMRALKLRQQVLLASQERDSQIKYDQNLVQSVFVNAVETGLSDEAIRTRMRPFLQTPNVTDETLIKEINIALSTENERQNKFGSRKKAQKSNATTTASVSAPPSKPTEQKAGKQNPLQATLEAIKADVDVLKEAIQSKSFNKEAKTGFQRPARPPSLCEACQNKGETDCEHCFICGSSEHFARGCKKRKSKQGNQKRLHRGDAV